MHCNPRGSHRQPTVFLISIEDVKDPMLSQEKSDEYENELFGDGESCINRVKNRAHVIMWVPCMRGLPKLRKWLGFVMRRLA